MGTQPVKEGNRDQFHNMTYSSLSARCPLSVLFFAPFPNGIAPMGLWEVWQMSKRGERIQYNTVL